jgi:hypothetical protein
MKQNPGGFAIKERKEMGHCSRGRRINEKICGFIFKMDEITAYFLLCGNGNDQSGKQC